MAVQLINIHLISIQQKRLVKKLHYFSCKNHNKQILKWCWNGWNQIQNPIIGLTSLVGLHWEKWTIFVGKIEGSQLKKFYTFLLSTQLYQKKERETSTISISKVGNWVFISPKSFLLLDLLQIFEEDYHLSDFRRRKKNNRALHTDAEKFKQNSKKSNNPMFSL